MNVLPSRQATAEIGVQTEQRSEEAMYIEMAPVAVVANAESVRPYSPTDSVSAYSGVQMASSFGSSPCGVTDANLSVAALNMAVANANMAVAKANLAAVADSDDEEVEVNVRFRKFPVFY